MSLKLNSSGGGSVTLQEPVTASDLTVNLPATLGNTGNSMVVTSDASGNVGIGTSTPTVRLQVTGGSTGTLAVQSTGTACSYPSSGAGMEFVAGSSTDTDSILSYNRTASSWRTLNIQTGTAIFTTVGSERMRIDSSGNVGIGTNSPADSLVTRRDQAATTRIRVVNKTGSGSATAGILFENSTSSTASVGLWDAGTVGALTAYGLNIEGTGTGGVNIAASGGSGVIRFATGGTTERLRIDTSGNVSSAGAQYLTRYYQTNSFTPSSGNWFRLCTLIATNAGQMVEFMFAIPDQHILLRVKFGKTTAGGLAGGGVLEVELLGSFVYYEYCPFDWRLVDGGTNGPSHIDIRFPVNTGQTLGSRINVLHSWSVDTGVHATFPLTNLGTGTTGASFSNMGDGSGWTKQWFKMAVNRYAFYDNNMALTSGATPPTA
jgi:hypothetical protein